MWINYKTRIVNLDNIESIELSPSKHTILAFGHEKQSMYLLYDSPDEEEVKRMFSNIQNFIDITAQQDVLYL